MNFKMTERHNVLQKVKDQLDQHLQIWGSPRKKFVCIKCCYAWLNEQIEIEQQIAMEESISNTESIVISDLDDTRPAEITMPSDT